jgi:hypothetical protein
MRPVFDRLAELGIPPEANLDGEHAPDMTLIHELDDLIRNGLDFKGADGIVEALN